MLTLILSLSLAQATQTPRHDSEPQPVLLSDTSPVFDVVAFDTGFLPSTSDPIAVRFSVTPTGGVTTEIATDSHLEWSESTGMEQALVCEPGGGWLAIDGSVDLVAEVHINVLGLWSGTVDVWSETADMFAETDFDELPLPGGSPGPTVILEAVDWIDPVVFEYTVITGLDLVFGVTVTPEIWANLEGKRVDALTADGMGTQVDAAGWAALPSPSEPAGAMPVSLTYVADLATELSFVFEPSVELDTLLGDFSLFSLPIDVPLLSAVEERSFTPVDANHPLPWMTGLPEAIDLGTAPIGQLAAVSLPLWNDGEMTVDGAVFIEGSDDITVFPDRVYMPPGGTDGLTVSFLPVLEGVRAVTLVIESNDPFQPRIEIPVVGEGLAEESSETEPPQDNPIPRDEPSSESSSVQGCGCASSGASGWASLLILPALLRRRRRS